MTPDELSVFVDETRDALAAAGLSDAAKSLGEVQAAAYTTSSEWLGELGAAVRAIRQSGEFPADIEARLTRILAAARAAWPRL